MAGYYIDKDQQVHTFECTRDGILLDDGRELLEGNYDFFWLFAVHPDDNKHLEKIDGVWYITLQPGLLRKRE